MNRRSGASGRILSDGVLALLASMTLAAPASADVIEIGDQGAVWVARDAQLPPAALHAPPPTGPAETALTQVADVAGPGQWQDRVAQLAAKYDISPQLLEALVWQESRWQSGAVSPAGARGLAQLMPGTARQLGVASGDPGANLEGGARYLRQQLDRFGGDVEKALAAYNAGPGRVARAGGIPPIAETRLYVEAIMTRLAQPVRR